MAAARTIDDTRFTAFYFLPDDFEEEAAEGFEQFGDEGEDGLRASLTVYISKSPPPT